MANKYIQSMMGQNERIVLVTRQHWFVLLSSIVAEMVVMLIVVGVIIATAIINPLAAFSFLLTLILLGLLILLALILLAVMLRDILVWYNREYIVTNRRVIQIYGIVNKSVVDSSLEKVNDVKMNQSFFGRMFDYGDVEILTASELGVNLFKRIGDPVKFKTAMMNAKEKLGFEGMGNHGQVVKDVPTLIAELDELRKKGIVSDAEFQQKKRELLAKM